MTDLQRKFCEEYVLDYSIVNAARRAGYSGENARISAWQALQNEDVQEYIEKLHSEAAKRCEITKDQWLNEWKIIGFSNIRNYMTDSFDAKSLDDMLFPEAIRSVKKTITKGEDWDKEVIEFTLHDKPSALTNIGRHLGFYEKDNKQKSDIILRFDKDDDQLGGNVSED